MQTLLTLCSWQIFWVSRWKMRYITAAEGFALASCVHSHVELGVFVHKSVLVPNLISNVWLIFWNENLFLDGMIWHYYIIWYYNDDDDNDDDDEIQTCTASIRDFPRRRWLPLGQVRASNEGAALHFELSQFVIGSSHSSVKPHENTFYVRSGAFCSWRKESRNIDRRLKLFADISSSYSISSNSVISMLFPRLLY